MIVFTTTVRLVVRFFWSNLLSLLRQTPKNVFPLCIMTARQISEKLKRA